jgi:comEA protein
MIVYVYAGKEQRDSSGYPSYIGNLHRLFTGHVHLAPNLNGKRQEVNMTQNKKLLTLLVILAMTVVSTVSLSAAVKPAAAGNDKLVNINSADSGQLINLPQIGPKMAQRILDYRKSNGNFKRVQDLMKVKGIGEKVFAKLQPLITI